LDFLPAAFFLADFFLAADLAAVFFLAGFSLNAFAQLLEYRSVDPIRRIVTFFSYGML
jgi:hypothetical protein